MISIFLFNLKQYGLEIIPSVLLGFLLSGIIHEFVPQNIVNKYLGKKDIWSLLRVSLLGIILPLCCFGSLPVAVGFKKKGMPLGSILAFLVTTPATSISAILITYKLLGLKFTIYLCLVVILMGIIIGIIGNLLKVENEINDESDICPMCEEASFHLFHMHHQKGFKKKIISILTYSFIDLPKEIGLELIIGIILAAVVATITPIGLLIKKYLSGPYGYLFAIIFGLLMYICATASVPLVAAFLHQGLNIGAGMVLLMVGPITSYGTILVIRKEFGFKVLIIYLALITILSLIFGYLFTYF
ncbi:MAG: permease [candidate division WOR-3 bacterium]|uniref:Permease n=1 Tax=candidate division WOR-3 bacterium TaxID=2052148 RepID=A0A7V4CHJ9_UNCW3